MKRKEALNEIHKYVGVGIAKCFQIINKIYDKHEEQIKSLIKAQNEMLKRQKKSYDSLCEDYKKQVEENENLKKTISAIKGKRMKTLPSKELLSEVFALKINLVETDEHRRKIYYYCNQFGKITGEINIYELAHKCKEWANNKGYVIFSSVQLTGWAVFIQTDQGGIIASFEGIEQEAIFKACEYIMEQTNAN